MVGEHHIALSIQVRAPPLAGGNYGQELAISGGIVSFRRVHLAAEVLDRLHALPLVLLQLSSDGELAGICPDLKGTREVGYQKHWGFCQAFLQGGERLFFRWAPFPGCILAQELGQWAGNIREVADEALVVVGHTQEDLQLLLVAWPRPGGNGFYLCRIRGNSGSMYHVAQVLHAIKPKRTLTALGKQPMLPQLRKYPCKMLCMSCIVGGKDEDVIEIHSAKLIQMLSENIIHEALESCRGVHEPKWHNCVLE